MDMRYINQTIIDGVANDVPLTDIYADFRGAVGKTGFYKIVLSLIETNAIPNIMVCYCGVDCARCRTFRATIDNDDEARKTVKAFYEEIGCKIEIKDLNCFGCRSDETMSACADCPYMKCGKEKGLQRCDECKEYPCESLRSYIETYVKPSAGKLIMP